MTARVLVLEPSAAAFVDAVFALVDDLCADARADPRSPRYFFGFASPEIVEDVRTQLVAMERAAWASDGDCIRTPSGQVLLAGAHPVRDWPLERAVLVCSDDYPDTDTLRSVRQAKSVILVLDPIRPPTHAETLRNLDDG